MSANVNEKSPNSQISSIDIWFARLARNEFKSWHYAKEHRTGLLVALGLKFGTMFILASCGYLFMNSMLNGLLNYNLGIYIAFALVIAVELMIAYLLAKTVKFSLKKEWLTTGIYFVFAALLYGLEFYTTTTGLANNEAQKADKTIFITDDYKLKSDSIINVYNNRIAFIKENPAKFAPDASGKWNARRLSNAQLAEISILENQKDLKLQVLKNEQNATLTSNTEHTDIVYTKYYSFVTVIMILQLISNAFLMFSYSRIYTEQNRAEELQDKAQKQNAILTTGIENFLFDRVFALQSFILNSFKMPYENITAKELTPGNYAGNANNAGRIGFQIINQKDTENTPNIDNGERNTVSVNNPPLNGERNGKNSVIEKAVKKCPVCSAELKTKHWAAVYCSDECRINAWQVRTGKVFNKRK